MQRLLFAVFTFCLLCSGVQAAVTIDATGTLTYNGSTSTSLTYTGIIIGSGANRGLVVSLTFDVSNPSGASPSGVSCTWDSGGTNQVMTSLVSENYAGETTGSVVFLVGLAAPTSGNKTLSCSWTTAAAYYIDAISFNGVLQTGGAVSFPNAAGIASTETITITSATGDYVVASGFHVSSNFSGNLTPGSTALYTSTSGSFVNSYASYEAGASSVTIGATVATNALVGTDVAAAASGVTPHNLLLTGAGQ